MDGNIASRSSEARNVFFQKLKPSCVQISQLAIRQLDTSAASQELRSLTSKLHGLLQDQVQNNPLALDEKLAEYAFFPLYYVFRQLDKYPMPVIENCVRCLNILIVHGWKSRISPKLVQQILTLLTFIIGGVPGSQTRREVPEEAALESYRGLRHLFDTVGTSPTAAAGLTDAETLPALGHAITVMIDGVSEGVSSPIQQEALRCIQAVFKTIRDHAALAKFLPGTVSALTNVLSAPARQKRLVLVRCLATFQTVLVKVLADIQTRSILAKIGNAGTDDKERNDILSPAWLKATAVQIRKALATVMKLRNRPDPAVASALGTFCVSLLDECHNTLKDCRDMLVETAIMLDAETEDSSLHKTSLRDIVSIYPELGDTVKATMYNWSSSFARVMQGSDEDTKLQAIKALSSGLKLLKALQIQSAILEENFTRTLRDSVVYLAMSSGSLREQPLMTMQLLTDQNDMNIRSSERSYAPVLLARDGQRRTLNGILELIRTVAENDDLPKIVNNMMENLAEEENSKQVSSFWLCFELIKAAQKDAGEIGVFIDISAMDGSGVALEAASNELYSLSVQVIDSHTEASDVDWRLEAIALEVLAYTAQKSGRAFRPELIDVLFPITTLLGSDTPNLQQHAVATLNHIALACEYGNVSEMIIDNVDYMVNSVALRLNTLDISPSSTQVLLMMIRLTGPHLIPYLDDTIDSVFAALENYHGYPAFVEGLFAVLKETVDQGVKSGSLLWESQKSTEVNHRKQPPETKGLANLIAVIRKRKAQMGRDAEEVVPARGHPTEPWKSTESEKEGDGDDQAGLPPEPEKPPNSPTYQLLQRITNLTQYYLTSPTPKLRRLLLELLETASDALAVDEDTFLPLVNAVWPVVIARIYDDESFVVIEACNAVAGLCRAAGDFLASRLRDEWWDNLGKWCRKVRQPATSGGAAHTPRYNFKESDKQLILPFKPGGGPEFLSTPPGIKLQTSGGLGEHASPMRVWEAVVKLLTAIVTHVRIEEGIFDDILDLLSDVMEKNVQAREALEVVNADAVWLLRYEKGLVTNRPTPQMAGIRMVSM